MVMFMKNAHCVLVLIEQLILCATTFTHLWERAWSYNLLLLVWDTSSTEMTPLCVRGWFVNSPDLGLRSNSMER